MYFFKSFAQFLSEKINNSKISTKFKKLSDRLIQKPINKKNKKKHRALGFKSWEKVDIEQIFYKIFRRAFLNSQRRLIITLLPLLLPQNK